MIEVAAGEGRYGCTETANERRTPTTMHLQATPPTPVARDRTAKTAKRNHASESKIQTSTRTRWTQNQSREPQTSTSSCKPSEEHLSRLTSATKRKCKTSLNSSNNAPKSRRSKQFDARKTTKNYNKLRSSSIELTLKQEGGAKNETDITMDSSEERQPKRRAFRAK